MFGNGELGTKHETLEERKKTSLGTSEQRKRLLCTFILFFEFENVLQDINVRLLRVGNRLKPWFNPVLCVFSLIVYNKFI